MVEVLKSNFRDLLPNIYQAIEKACFISIDTEFTGLDTSSDNRSSFFDSLEAHYQKLVQGASSFTICQLGLTAFTRASNSNVYSAETYIFYLRPHHYGSKDNRFMLQASCVDFLIGFDFDFNKFLVEGMPYLNETEEKQAQEQILNGTLNACHFHNIGEHGKKKQDLDILSWLSKASEGDKMHISLEKVGHEFFQLQYFRSKYPEIWAFVGDDGQIVLQKVSLKEKQKRLKSAAAEEQRVFEYFLGFAHVYKKLKECKKILVGHNLLKDLLLFYSSFYQPLPKTFQEFKQNILSLFPSIYDTKHIWMNVKQFYDVGKISRQSGLYEIYSLLKECPPEKLSSCYSPGIELKNSQYDSQFFPHNAGYDSFLTGWVFLKVCHIIAIKRTKSIEQIVPQTWAQHLKAVKSFENKINISRAKVHFINLDGLDPPTHRPQYLYVKLKNRKSHLSPVLVEQKLGMYGFVEVRQTSRLEALVAVASFGCAKDILKDLSNDHQYLIENYNAWQHSWPARTTLWVASGCSLCASVYFLYKCFR